MGFWHYTSIYAKFRLNKPQNLSDEVRELGRLLNIPSHLVGRHPFPGPGLAIRILGPVTRGQVEILQKADSIYIEEIRKAGLYDQISQAFAALLPVKAVGVQGDRRTYDQVSLASGIASISSYDRCFSEGYRAAGSNDR